MKKNIPAITLCMVCIAGAFTFGKMKNQKSDRMMPTGFALVELFTSEGCSSCPPADEIIGNLQDQYKDRHVLALSFHVDYWDHLGWKDPYSAAAFTSRQEYYAGIFSLSSIYTPQAVINGADEFVGSNQSKLKRSIEETLKSDFTKSIQVRATSDNNANIGVDCSVKMNDAEGHQLIVVLVQKSGTHRVGRGENAGKTLHHFNIVRGLVYLPVSEKEIQTSFSLPEGLHKEDVFIAAYTQNKKTGNITAVDSTRIN